MARANEEKPNEYQDAMRDHQAWTDSARPQESLTYATRLRQYRLVQDVAADPRRIQHAADASTEVRGLLIQDQQTTNSLTGGDVTLDENSDLTFIVFGKARAITEEVMAKHQRFVAGTNGAIRAYVAGVDDPGTILGRTECSNTVIGDIVDIFIDVSKNGA